MAVRKNSEIDAAWLSLAIYRNLQLLLNATSIQS